VPSEFEQLFNVAAGFVQRVADQARARVEEFADAQADGVWGQVEHDLRLHGTQLGDSLHLNYSFNGDFANRRTHPVDWNATFRRPSRAYSSVADEAEALASGTGEISISVDFHHIGAEIRYSCVITRRDQVVRKGPSGVIPAPLGAISAYGGIKGATAKIGKFIGDSGEFIREQLLSGDIA
jgi:hypothetical protein